MNDILSGGMFTTAFKGQRIPRDDLYMAVAELFSLRSTCLRGQTGCVAVKDNRIIAGGYNGSPPGMPHCIDVGCGGGVWEDNPDWPAPTDQEMQAWSEHELNHHLSQRYIEVFPNGCTRTIHAELNMVAFAARHGVPLEGSIVYVTSSPCRACAQSLIGAGITGLMFKELYRLTDGLELIDKANIIVEQYEPTN